MSRYNNRPPSPPDYRDPYYNRSSRASGVIPVSSQTFVNGVPVGTRSYDSYAEPRHSVGTIPADIPQRRTSTVTGSSAASRSRNVVQNIVDRPASPTTRTSKYRYDTGPTDASSVSRGVSKKIYAVDDGRSTRVVDSSSSARKDSLDRDGGRRGYYPSGQSSRDDYSRYDKGDAHGLYVDTEPRNRRRDSVDMSSSARAPIDGFGIIAPPRRDGGPPPATRGLDKISGGVARHGSLRDTPRSAAYYRDRRQGSYSEDDDVSTVSAKLMPTSQSNPLYYELSPERENFDDRFETSSRRPNWEDEGVASRGFGIRGGNAAVPYLRESGRDAVPHLEPGTASVPYPRTSNVDLRSDFSAEPTNYGASDDLPRGDRRIRDRDRDVMPNRSREDGRRRARESDYDDDDPGYRPREHRRDREKERHDDEGPRARDKRSEVGDRRDKDRGERDRDDRRQRHEDSGITPEMLTALAGGAAAFGATGLLSRDREKDRDKGKDTSERDDSDRRDRARERDRERERERERERDRERDRDRPDRSKEAPTPAPAREEREPRDRPREQPDPRPREQPDSDRERADREREQRNRERDLNRDREREADRLERERIRELQEEKERREGDRPREMPVQEARERPPLMQLPTEDEIPRERRYVGKEDRRERPDQQPTPASAVDPDEDYRRRVQAESQRTQQGRTEDTASPVDEPRRRHRDERSRGLEEDPRRSLEPLSQHASPAQSQTLPPTVDPRNTALLDAPLTEEPSDVEGSSSERRVRIVEPSRSTPEPPFTAVKSILRKPKERFPEDPNPIREGVAPLKDATKKGVPPGARWTKIDRRLVNPDALDEAKERYEERQDSVIVLRVLTKEEIQKFAERTREIRDERYEQRHRRKGDHDATDAEYDDRERKEDEPKQLTWEGQP